MNQDIATTGVSIAKKGVNQVEKEVQAAVNTKKRNKIKVNSKAWPKVLKNLILKYSTFFHPDLLGW